MPISRRNWMRSVGLVTSGLLAGDVSDVGAADVPKVAAPPLTITDLLVTPIALPDPPLLNAGGLHGPYFLRNIVQLKTDAGIVGIGETTGGAGVTAALEKARDIIRHQNAFAFRAFRPVLEKLNTAAYMAVELACLDACGRATGRR